VTDEGLAWELLQLRNAIACAKPESVDLSVEFAELTEVVDTLNSTTEKVGSEIVAAIKDLTAAMRESK
jgi:hypothetical protein